MRFQGQRLGFVAGSSPNGKSVIFRLPHGDLSKAPRLGDLLIVCNEITNHKWLTRVENQSHVSIELHEQEVRNAIARGQTSLGQELSDHEKEMYLGHDFELKLLGEIRDGFKFAPIVRELPPRGSTVNHLKIDELKQLVTLDNDGAHVGYYAVGDEVHDSNSNQIPVKFSVKRFVSRRSAIFGVAGFGKSNLMKNILAELTVSEPEVGKLVFDLDGEYSFSRSDSEKGLADIPLVAERLAVFTNVERVEQKYRDVIHGEPVLNLGELSARKVVSALIPESRQDRVYAELLRNLNPERWRRIIDQVAKHSYDTNEDDIAEILGIKKDDNLASIQGMIRALVSIVRGHSSTSTMLREVLRNLQLGATVVIDLSSMDLGAAYSLTTFMVDELFESNQSNYVSGIKVPEIIVFVEEAQNLLSDKQVKEGNPIARLAKEGRKYNLGLVYISQQPGAIAKEILTQTNTFFALHLLAKPDIHALQEINPHYEGVIADFIQMESLQGHAYIYSTVPNMPTQSYVFATKSISFNNMAMLLSSRPPSGTKRLAQQKKEILDRLSSHLTNILSMENPISENGERKYKNAPISSQLAKYIAKEYPFLLDKNPDYVKTEFMLEACAHIGLDARIVWEGRAPYLYIKNSQAGPKPIQRVLSQDTGDDIPF